MTHGDFKDLARRTTSEKVLCHKAFSITKNLKYDEYQYELLLCVIDTFSKYAWVAPLKDEKYISSTNAFQKTLDETEGRKPSKIG